MTDPALSTLILLILLTVKHLIADFALQSRYILDNRRFYGHPAGILHVAIHLVGTLAVLVFIGTPALLILAMLFVEGLVHYHLDWAKDNLVLKLGLNDEKRGYWILLGADQMCHQLTYIGLALWWYLSA